MKLSITLFALCALPATSALSLRGNVRARLSADASTACSSRWAQCGGKEWAGPTCCDESDHVTCEYQNDYYSQCVPTVEVVGTCAAEYAQCGGQEFTGHTDCCLESNVCVKKDDYYSQCLPRAPAPPCEQDAKLAKYHEGFDKLEGSFTTDAQRWDAASAACASRGQYLCTPDQNAEQCSVAHNYPGAAYLAVGDASGAKAWVDVGPSGDGSTLLTAVPSSTGDRLFSCCGARYPGDVAQATTTLIAVNLAEEGQPAELVFVTEPRLMELVNGVSFEAEAEAEAEAGVGVGCAWETDEETGERSFFCGAEAEAELRATLRVEASTTVATVGGVPIVGTVYYEATVGVAAGATAGVTDEGLVVGASVSIDASVTYGVEFSGEVAEGVEVSGGVSASAGVEATAEAGATVTLSEVSADWEVGVEFGVGVEVEGGVEADEGSASGTAGACTGCAGVGFSPSIGFSGCTASVGAEGTVAVVVGGVNLGFEAEADACAIGAGIAKIGADAVSWSESLASDAGSGLTSLGNAVAAGTVGAFYAASDGVMVAVDETEEFFTEDIPAAAEETADFFEDVGKGIGNAFSGF